MKVKVLCRNCNKSYYWFADDGSVLDCGCEFHKPEFSKDKPIVCYVYKEKNNIE